MEAASPGQGWGGPNWSTGGRSLPQTGIARQQTPLSIYVIPYVTNFEGLSSKVLGEVLACERRHLPDMLDDLQDATCQHWLSKQACLCGVCLSRPRLQALPFTLNECLLLLQAAHPAAHSCHSQWGRFTLNKCLLLLQATHQAADSCCRV